MIHQHFALLGSRTAAGNVAFPLEVMGVPRAERSDRVAELLDLVGLADHAGATETVAGLPAGRLRIALPGSPEVNQAPLEHLRDLGLIVEVAR